MGLENQEIGKELALRVIEDLTGTSDAENPSALALSSDFLLRAQKVMFYLIQTDIGVLWKDVRMGRLSNLRSVLENTGQFPPKREPPVRSSYVKQSHAERMFLSAFEERQLRFLKRYGTDLGPDSYLRYQEENPKDIEFYLALRRRGRKLADPECLMEMVRPAIADILSDHPELACSISTNPCHS